MAFTHLFDIKKINALRLLCQEFSHEGINPFMKEGWGPNLYNFETFLSFFQHLKLKKGYRIEGYQYLFNRDGNSLIFVLPDKLNIKPSSNPDISLEELSLPVGSDKEFMNYIQGDYSPDSYLEASIFKREILELGAFGHGQNWNNFSILNDVKEVEDKGLNFIHSDSFDIGSFSPRLIREENHLSVTFYTYTQVNVEAVYKNTDIYSFEGYDFKSKKEIVAKGNAVKYY